MRIKNIDTHKIEIPFEGTTYIFEPKKTVEVDDVVGNFVSERFPLSFAWGAKVQKDEEASPVETYKTKVYLNSVPVDNDMQVSRKMSVEEQEIDNNDGDWYGEGVQIDTL